MLFQKLFVNAFSTLTYQHCDWTVKHLLLCLNHNINTNSINYDLHWGWILNNMILLHATYFFAEIKLHQSAQKHDDNTTVTMITTFSRLFTVLDALHYYFSMFNHHSSMLLRYENRTHEAIANCYNCRLNSYIETLILSTKNDITKWHNIFAMFLSSSSSRQSISIHDVLVLLPRSTHVNHMKHSNMLNVSAYNSHSCLLPINNES